MTVKRTGEKKKKVSNEKTKKKNFQNKITKKGNAKKKKNKQQIQIQCGHRN